MHDPENARGPFIGERLKNTLNSARFRHVLQERGLGVLEAQTQPTSEKRGSTL